MIKYVNDFIKKIKNFGLKISFYSYLAKVLQRVLPNSHITQKIISVKNEMIINYLYNKYEYVVKKFQKCYCGTRVNSNIIWIFWWQGLDSAPYIVKKCVQSITKFYPDCIIHIIDRINLSDFIEIDSKIMDKVQAGIISYTHFSDIVRMKLLSKYGGTWMDSTIFLTDKVKLDEPLVTLHLDESDNNNRKMISQGKWCGFFLGGEDNCIPKFVDEIFGEYWKNEDILIDYFLIDYVIELGYRNIPYIKNLIDNVPYNNKGVFVLQSKLNEKFDEKYFQNLCKETSVHKLSYKEEIFVEKNKNTFYKYLFAEDLK